jgi:hypothetical protein
MDAERFQMAHLMKGALAYAGALLIRHCRA